MLNMEDPTVTVERETTINNFDFDIFFQVHSLTSLYFSPYIVEVWVRFMLLNATFNDISVISWWSVLLVEESQ
jgi:hypothetical protein